MLTNHQVQKAIWLLANNQIVILPTDTIYGISAVINPANQKRINEIKMRKFTQPIIVLFSRFQQIENFVELTDQLMTYLKAEIPTTVIFAVNGDVNQTIGLRLVKRKDLKKIVDEVGPIFSTSVNDHGQNPINDLKGLTNFNLQIPVFFDEKSVVAPSRIYNSLTGEWIR